MKRKQKQQRTPPPGMKCVPFAQEQHEGLRALMMEILIDSFIDIAQDEFQAARRGLLVWMSTDGTIATLQPPVYVPQATWLANPALVNTPHDDLNQAIAQYEPRVSHIVLVLSPDSERANTLRYTWWKAQHPAASILN